VASEIMPKENRIKRNGWYDGKCKEATDKKNQAYRDMIQGHYTKNAEEKYKELKKQEKQIHKKKENLL
jgi:hypothetical protein